MKHNNSQQVLHSNIYQHEHYSNNAEKKLYAHNSFS